MSNIIKMIVADNQLSTLTSAITAAGMIDTLSGSGPFTLFAPTDIAFGLLPLGMLHGLLQPDARATLTTLMTLHVLAGKTKAEDLTDKQLLRTVNGQCLPVDVTNGLTSVGFATIIYSLEASNGHIHIIDSVLIPL